MARKFLSYAGLQRFLVKLKGEFAKIVHYHQLDDVIDVELTEDNEAELVVPIEYETLQAIAAGEYTPEDTAMFTGNSQYTPMTSAEVAALVNVCLEAAGISTEEEETNE